MQNSVAEARLDFSTNGRNHRTVAQDILLHSSGLTEDGYIPGGQSVYYLM